MPNPALAEWLFSSQCRAAIEEITARIFFTYENSLPVRTTRLNRQPPPGNLKAEAYWEIRPGGFGVDQDRWFGYVGNRAEYAAVIEYGGRRFHQQAQHQLRDAAHLIVGNFADAAQASAALGGGIPRVHGTVRNERGHYVRGNTAHRARGRNSLGQFK